MRNEAAEDYFALLKEWKKLCERYPEGCVVEEDSDEEEEGPPLPGEYEVERLIGIRWIGEVSEKDKEVMEQVDDMEDSEELSEMKLPKQASLKSSASKEPEPDLAKGLEFKVMILFVFVMHLLHEFHQVQQILAPVLPLMSFTVLSLLTQLGMFPSVWM